MTHHYIGTKEVLAWAAEKDGKPGYGIKYTDGYTSWSPRDVFEVSYRTSEPGMSQTLTFGDALHFAKQGLSVARAGWNGKGMFVFLIQGSNDIAKLHGYGFGELANEPTFRDALFMRTADNQLVPWTISQADALANDWMVL